MPALFNKLFEQFSLASRLLLLGTTAFLIGSMSMLYVTASGMKDNAQIEMSDQLRDGLDSLTFEISDYAVVGDYASIQQTLKHRAEKRNVASVSWIYDMGTVTEKRQSLPYMAPDWFFNLMQLPAPAGEKALEVGGRLYGKVSITLSNAAFINSIWATFIKQTRIVAVGGVLFMILAALLLKWGLHPLYLLANAAQSFGRGDYTIRIPTGGAPEIQPSIVAFNEMAQEVEELLQSLKESHYAQSEQLHFNQQLLAVLPIPIFFKARDGSYLGGNQAWENLFGVKSVDFVSKTLNELYPDTPEVALRHRLMDNELWQTPGNQSYEINIAGSSGKRFDTIYYKSTFTHTDGSVAGLIGAIIDISDRKAAELREKELNRQLLQATKMEAIGHLTGGIAHDFNNILAGVLGYVELAKIALKKGASNLPDKLSHYLKEVETAGTRAKDLVSQMLVFSRLAPDMQDGNVAPVLLKPILKEVIGLLRSSFPASIELNYQIEDAHIKGVILPVHLHQILLNLGINAKDAIGEYGKIDFKLSTHTFDHANCTSCKHAFSGEYIDISVADNGSGIAPHILTKAFDPFFTTKDVGKGTGMGLSVVHGIVHSLGGHILVDSEDGKGTTFHILLPFVETQSNAEAEAAEAASETDRPLAGLRIMVVDDELICTAMLQELLTVQGASVDSFNQSPSALEAFMQHPNAMDVVITDETMPDLSGLDMSLEMLKQRPDLPIILCTGFSLHATPDTAKMSGIAAFMNKPVHLPKLVETILQLTRKHETSA